MPRPDPAYKTVAEWLRTEIEAGAYPPTRRLPTDAELGAQFAVSRQTVRQAFNQLVAEGLVYRVPRRGSFAVATAPGDQYLRSLGSIDDLLALSVDTELEVVRPFAPIVDAATAARLQLAGDVISRGVFRRLHAGLPFGVTTFNLPLAISELIAGDPRLATAGTTSSVTIIQLIEEARRIPITGARQSISAAVLDQMTAKLLDARRGDPALTVERMYVDAAGEIVEIATSFFNVARYSYRLQLRRNLSP